MSTPPSIREGLAGTGEPRLVGRYALYDEIAAGGMATVHLGRLLGPVGFSRTVAIKRLHPQFARDPEFVAMFLDEARLAARIRHPNVVATLDVVALDHELFLVMDYVQGESLSRLVRASKKHESGAPLSVVTTIMAGVLHGLHAAHEAKTEQGEALSIVHRDVSPQNVLVGIDGVPRVLDFGVAKAAHRSQTTRQGQVKGKIAYMAPEQLRSEHVDRRCDVFAAAAVLWEAVTRKRLFNADSDAAVLAMVLFQPAPSPRSVVPDLDPELERIIMRGLERDRDKRYATAREMALELENCLPVASASAIGGWVERLAGDALAHRAARVTDIESNASQPVALAAPTAQPAPTAPITQPDRDERTDRATTSSHVSRVAAPRSPPNMRVAAVTAAVVLLAGIALFAAHAMTRGPEPSAAAAPPPPSASAEPARAPTPLPDKPLAAPAESAAAPVVTAKAAPVVTAKAAPTPRATAASPPRASCTPPYTVDRSGLRHMKPECL